MDTESRYTVTHRYESCRERNVRGQVEGVTAMVDRLYRLTFSIVLSSVMDGGAAAPVHCTYNLQTLVVPDRYSCTVQVRLVPALAGDPRFFF